MIIDLGGGRGLCIHGDLVTSEVMKALIHAKLVEPDWSRGTARPSYKLSDDTWKIDPTVNPADLKEPEDGEG